jgi:hypothetical protein
VISKNLVDKVVAMCRTSENVSFITCRDVVFIFLETLCWSIYENNIVLVTQFVQCDAYYSKRLLM